MWKLECPHCGKRGISPVRKMWLGPALPATCTACGKKVGVPYVAALLAFLPFFVAIGVAAFTEPFALKACLWVGGFVVMSAIYLLWVPLEPRGLNKGAVGLKVIWGPNGNTTSCWIRNSPGLPNVAASRFRLFEKQ